MSEISHLMLNNAHKAVIFSIATPIGVLSSILCLFPFIAMLKNPLVSSQHILKCVLRLTVGSIGCYSFSMIFFSIGNLFKICDKKEPMIAFICIGLFAICHIISQVLIYTLLMFRVYHTFKDTEYSLHKCTYICFAILVIIFFIVSILGIVYNYLLTLSDEPNLPFINLSHLGIGIASTRQIVDFLITVYLVTLFIKQLLCVTVQINDNKLDELSMESGLIIRLDESQHILLNVMTRFFVLALFATISTQINLLIGTITLIGQYLDDYNTFLCGFALHWWLIPVDCVVNSACLYLMLEANNKEYMKICKKCDGRSRMCCQSVAKRWIKKSYSTIQDDIGKHLDSTHSIQLLDESDI